MARRDLPQITLRFTEEERRDIDAAASRAGMAREEWLRTVALHAARIPASGLSLVALQALERQLQSALAPVAWELARLSDAEADADLDAPVGDA